MTTDLERLLALVKVGTEEECEAADFVICANVGFFDDDVVATCSHCGAAIVHRPHVPKRPPKICMRCYKLQMESENLPHA